MRTILLLFCLLFSGVSFSQDKVIDSLRALLKVARQDTARINLLNTLSYKSTDASQYDPAFAYAREALVLSTRLDFKSGAARANVMMGRSVWKKGDIDNAIPYYFKAEKLYAESSNDPELARTRSNIGLMYTQRGKYPQSIDYFYKSLGIYETLKDSHAIAKVQLNLGFSYIRQLDTAKSKPQLLLALKGLKRFGDIPGQIQTLQNLGSLYVLYPLKEDSAVIYFEMALDLSKRFHDPKNESSALVNLGVAYRNLGDTAKSLEYLEKALKMKQEMQDMEGVAVALMDIGVTHEFQHRTALAIQYFEKAAAIAEELGSWNYITKANDHLRNLYARQKDYKNAYRALVLRMNANDSMFNAKGSEKMLKAEMNFNFEKKELAMKAETEKREAIYRQESRLQKIIIASVSAILALVLVIAILLFRQIRYRNQQREIQLEHKLLRTQMNPHFLFNSLHAIQNFVLTNNSRDAAKYLSSFAKITRSVLESSRMELIPVKNEIALLENYMQLQKLRFGDRFDYFIHVDPELETEHTLIPPMLAQPFIENALEHGMRDIVTGGRIDVSFTKKEGQLLFEIKDNGNGMEQGASRNRKYESLATAITNERIGLFNRKNPVKLIFTIAEAYPDEARKGVKVSFIIPIHHFTA